MLRIWQKPDMNPMSGILNDENFLLEKSDACRFFPVLPTISEDESLATPKLIDYRLN